MDLPREGREEDPFYWTSQIILEQLRQSFLPGARLHIATAEQAVIVAEVADAAEFFERDSDKAQPVEASQSGKNAKKNRKERERRARKKRKQKPNATSSGTATNSAEADFQEFEEGVGEHGEVVEEHGIDQSTTSGGAREAFMLSQSVQAGEAANETRGSSRIYQGPADVSENDVQGPVAVDRSPAANVEGADRAEAFDKSKAEAPTPRYSPQPTASEPTTEHEDYSPKERNSPKLPHAEPHKLRTKPKQPSQISLPSSLPATAPKITTATTTIPSISRTPRPLMIPAVPFNLQFSKKYSLTMQHETPDTHCPASDPESEKENLILSSPAAVSSESPAPAPAKASSAPVSLESTAPTAPCASSLEMSSESSAPPAPAQAPPVAASSESSAPTPAQAPPLTVSSKSSAPTPAQAPPVAVSSDSSAPAPAQAPAQPKLVQFDTYEWPCRKQECRKLTSPYDGSTVICPRCGPYSKIRYCSKKCLFDDLLMHWGVECGNFTLAQKADPMTITAGQVKIQPYIPSLSHHDRPERFRQFVRHSIDRTGDYFVFSDWADWRAEGFPMPWPATKLASGSVLIVLNFTQTGSSVPSRVLFTRLIRICFLTGSSRNDMSYFLFKMIIGRLNELGLATEDVKNCLVWQFKHEFAYPGGFAELLMDQQPVNWPLVAGQVVQLENQYRAFLFGGAGVGPEWTNKV